MKPKRVIYTKPNGETHSICIELDKETDVTPYMLLSLSYPNCDMKLEETETMTKIWFYNFK